MVTKRQPKQDTKARIVQSAIRSFIKNGVAQTTMREIAQGAGVDQPLLHYYFNSSEELHTAVVHAVLESLTGASVKILETETDPEKLLKQYIRGTFDWTRRNPGLFSIWVYFYHLATFHPTYIEINQLVRQRGRDRIALFLYQGIEKGVFRVRKGFSVPEVALNIQGLLTGNCIMAGSEGTKDWSRFCDATIQGAFAWLEK